MSETWDPPAEIKLKPAPSPPDHGGDGVWYETRYIVTDRSITIAIYANGEFAFEHRFTGPDAKRISYFAGIISGEAMQARARERRR